MSLDSRAMFNALTSLAAISGVFDSVTGHEPKAAPSPTGVSCSVWISDMRAVQSSGLAAISMRCEFQMRVFTSGLREPADAIDPAVIDAVDVLLAGVIGNFDLDLPDGRYVDVLGSDGDQLRAVSGWLVQDQKQYRVMDLFVPVIVNDTYAEVK